MLYNPITTGNLYAIKEGDIIAFRDHIPAVTSDATEERYFIYKVLYEDELFCCMSRLGNSQNFCSKDANRELLLNGCWYLVA